MYRYAANDPGEPPSERFPDIALLNTNLNLTIVADAGVAADMTNAWALFSIVLRETNGWHIDSLTNRAPTEMEFIGVLSNITHLYVRGEYINNTDTGYLDNFEITDGECPSSSIHFSEIEVCWQSRLSGVYQVQYRSELTTNQWLDLLGTNVSGDGSRICIPDRLTQPKRFYRVICVAP